MRRGTKLAIGIPVGLVGALLALAALFVLPFVGFDGTFTTPRTTASTDTHAIVISAAFLDDDLVAAGNGDGTVTLEVEGRSGEVFVGLADAADVASYLEDVSFAEATDLSYPGGIVTLHRVDGRAEPEPPGDEVFWSRSIEGDGTLTWDLAEGHWSVVLMNADGSAGVDVAGTATARIPMLGTALAVVLLVGVPMVIGGIAVIVSALRGGPAAERRARPAEPSAPPPRPDL